MHSQPLWVCWVVCAYTVYVGRLFDCVFLRPGVPHINARLVGAFENKHTNSASLVTRLPNSLGIAQVRCHLHQATACEQATLQRPSVRSIRESRRRAKPPDYGNSRSAAVVGHLYEV